MKFLRCDICDIEIEGRNENSDEITLDDSLRWDEYTRIFIRVTTGFYNHSTGFGGPPDLCKECFIILLERLIDKKKAD